MHTDPFRTGRDPHPDEQHHTQPGTFGTILPAADAIAIGRDAYRALLARARAAEPDFATTVANWHPDDDYEPEPDTFADGGAECDTHTLAAADLSPHLDHLARSVHESVEHARPDDDA